jgi:hypothetical protein
MPGKQALTLKNGRPAAYHERVRERIKTGMIVQRVQECALGKIEMTSTEFQAAKLLINKTIPDLPQVVHTDPLAGAKDISHSSPYHLLAIIEGESERKG